MKMCKIFLGNCSFVRTYTFSLTLLPPCRAAEYIFVPGTTNFGDLSCPLKNNQIIPFLPSLPPYPIPEILNISNKQIVANR